MLVLPVFNFISFLAKQFTRGVVNLTTIPNLENQVIPLCLGHHVDLSGMESPTSYNATASIALWII